MIASATGDDYARAIRTVAADPDVDAMIVIYIPPETTRAPEIGRAIAGALERIGGRIPVATTWMSTKGLPAALQEGCTRIPSFAFPEQAAIAMAHAAKYGAWRERPAGTIPHLHDTRIDEAVGIIANALGRGRCAAGSLPRRWSACSTATGSGRRDPSERRRPKRPAPPPPGSVRRSP